MRIINSLTFLLLTALPAAAEEMEWVEVSDDNNGFVLAVFQGHSHQNDLKEIGGIHYCVHRAMVEGSGEENNGYSTMDIFAGGTIRITGFRMQKNYDWA